jgi:uncharacterized protein
MKFTARNIHRDFGYFYVGLIIAFSISGIFLNHRQVWHPSKYKTEIIAVNVEIPADEVAVTKEFVEQVTQKLGIQDGMRRFKIEKGKFEVSYEKHDLKVDGKTGVGELITYQKVPVLAQMTQLHQDTSKWWIYYSDVFGIAMLTIAITGMLMIPTGNLSFKERGWKLAVLGIVFPLIFLFLLS